jgi:hypothetical protein
MAGCGVGIGGCAGFDVNGLAESVSWGKKGMTFRAISALK